MNFPKRWFPTCGHRWLELGKVFARGSQTRTCSGFLKIVYSLNVLNFRTGPAFRLVGKGGVVGFCFVLFFPSVLLLSSASLLHGLCLVPLKQGKERSEGQENLSWLVQWNLVCQYKTMILINSSLWRVSSKHLYFWGLSPAVALAWALPPVVKCLLLSNSIRTISLVVTLLLLNESLQFSSGKAQDHPWPGITGIQAIP